MSTTAETRQAAKEAAAKIFEQALTSRTQHEQAQECMSSEDLANSMHTAVTDALEEVSMILGVIGYADKTEEREIGTFEMRGIVSALDRTYDKLTEANLAYMNSK
ncbi:MAG: hypothetical protein HZA15_11110 [Nitrospirae bacterium]|nr:hypothetical protein [Nitrospirota bacterium]